MKRIVLALVLLLAPADAFAVNTPPLNLSQLPGGGPACVARGITVPPPQFDHPASAATATPAAPAMTAITYRRGFDTQP